MAETDIEQRLRQQFSPIELKVIDESHKHVGHPENLKGREKMLDVLIVSKSFEGKTRLERHAAIYACLGIGINAEIHGITIHAYSPGEWGKKS